MSWKVTISARACLSCVLLAAGCVHLPRAEKRSDESATAATILSAGEPTETPPNSAHSQPGQDPSAAPTLASADQAAPPPAPDEPASNNKNSDKSNGKDGEKKETKHIRDNAFLVEEAFNQEPGEVQHIFNWIYLWDRTQQGRTRDFAATYTMELPLGSQKHQFSFTTLFLTAFEQPNNGPAAQRGDIGDTFLNYRYQLLANDEFLWCAPRFSLILPTADRRFGLGTGVVGYQFNLPVSRYGDRFDFHFNAGVTYAPGVSVVLENGFTSDGRDLRAFNLGASTFWKPKKNLHFFIEAFALWFENLDDFGFRDQTTQVLVNPGVRYAVCQLDEVEWVIGASVPVGLTKDSPNIGLFVYMSVEHAFRKKNGNGGTE